MSNRLGGITRKGGGQPGGQDGNGVDPASDGTGPKIVEPPDCPWRNLKPEKREAGVSAVALDDVQQD